MSFKDLTVFARMSCSLVHDRASFTTLSSLSALIAYMLDPTEAFYWSVRI